MCVKTCNSTNSSGTGYGFEYKEVDGGYEITSCGKEVTEVVLPSVYNGKSVVSISSFAFSYCRKLSKVTIPESIVRIEQDAFFACFELKNIIFVDAENWYRTKDCVNWDKKEGWEITDLSDSETAAKHLTLKYYYYFWAKNPLIK